MQSIEIERKKLRQGFDKAIERCLREKARLGLDVVYADADGKPYTLPAAVALERFFGPKGQSWRKQ